MNYLSLSCISIIYTSNRLLTIYRWLFQKMNVINGKVQIILVFRRSLKTSILNKKKWLILKGTKNRVGAGLLILWKDKKESLTNEKRAWCNAAKNKHLVTKKQITEKKYFFFSQSNFLDVVWNVITGGTQKIFLSSTCTTEKTRKEMVYAFVIEPTTRWFKLDFHFGALRRLHPLSSLVKKKSQ